MRCVAALLGLLLIASAAAPDARAQADTSAARNPYGSGIGAEVVLTNSGFGLGGQLTLAFAPATSALLEVRLVPVKDPREAAFFDRFGRRDIPRKANYLLAVPLRLGFRQRVLQDYIADNFRPYVQLTVGPAFGWAYPYFEDANDNGRLDGEERVYGTLEALERGDPRWGVSAMLAVGAHFGTSTHSVRGLQIGYVATYFSEGVQLLEPQVQPARHYLGSPTISLTFGRLF